MRDDPYPARFYGRQIDEPFDSGATTMLVYDEASPLFNPLRQPLHRLLLLMMLYLCCALFVLFTATSYAAPLGSVTMPTAAADPCFESVALAAH